MNALLIDFEDSFTFNIAAYLKKSGFNVKVQHWKEPVNLDADLYILGPGPGHPSEYHEIFSMIQDLKIKKMKILGICLGHQILCLLDGFTIASSSQKVHGQQEEIELTLTWRNLWQTKNDSIIVQRYNSLCVLHDEHTTGDVLVKNNEVMARIFENTISYQFHPESIGTENAQMFFNFLRKTKNENIIIK